MEQIRRITHNNDHVDEETLIRGVWAVTRCNCELTNASLLPDERIIDMNGYTEPQAQIDARALRRALNQDAINLYLRQTTEADEEALEDCIFAAELDDAAEVDDNPADTAEELTARPLNPRTQFTACVEYEEPKFGSTEWYNNIKPIAF